MLLYDMSSTVSRLLAMSFAASTLLYSIQLSTILVNTLKKFYNPDQ